MLFAGNSLKAVCLLVFCVLFFTLSAAMAVLAQNSMYQRCEPSTDCVIGEYVFEDDGHTPITTDNYCKITITDPEDTVVANAVNMNDKNDGWYYYTANIASPSGLYRSTVCCDVGQPGEQCVDKTFVLGTSLDSVATKTDLLSLVSQIWEYTGGRTLSAFGNLAADVWNDTYASVRRLTDKALTGGGNLATESYIDSAKADLISEINENQALISALNDITAADVWSYASRGLTEQVEINATSSMAVWNVAKDQLTSSGSIGKQVADNLDAQVSSRSSLTAGDVWANATRTLTDYATSATSLSVWANAQRTLTDYGNDITAAQVWNTLSSSLTTAGSIGKQVADNVDTTISSRASQSSVDDVRASQQEQWTVYLSDVTDVSKGETYRAKLWTLDYESVPADAASTPTVTIYDPLRNKTVENVSMTKLSTGIYEYTYTVASDATQGTWETEVSATVAAGKTIKTNDYWNVAGSPAQVRINSLSDVTVPGIAASVTLTNEGAAGYEYTYEWCVVASQDNACGGNNDTFYSSAAKFIQPGEDWVTTLAATVPDPGNYWFKVVVHFGTQQSGASQSFTAASAGGGTGGSGTSGGSTGAGGQASLISALGKGVGTAFCSVFPCDIITKILARLDAIEKKNTDFDKRITSIERNGRVITVAPPAVTVKKSAPAAAPPPAKSRAKIRLETS